MGGPEDEFVIGLDEDFLNDVYDEISKEGLDCASVDVLISMARESDLDSVADVLGGLSKRGKPEWAAQIAKLLMQAPVQANPAASPDYVLVASMLVYLIDQDQLDDVHRICRHLLVANKTGGMDCYDLAMMLGHMVKQKKAGQAGRVLYALYCDESPDGTPYQSLVPFVLGTLADFGQLDWSCELAKQLCYADGEKEIDLSVLGWTLAQCVYFKKPEWGGRICAALKQQGLKWYDEAALLGAVSSWGGEEYSKAIEAQIQRASASAAGPPAAPSGAGGPPPPPRR